MSSVARRVAPPLLFVLSLIALWEAWVHIGDVPAYRVPAPSAVVTALWNTRSSLAGHFQTTLAETLLGTVLGAAFGVTTAVALAASPLARRTVEPVLVATQTIPLFVLAPLLVLWFGFGMTAKVVVVVLIVYFPVAVSTLGGLLDVPQDQVDLIRSLGGSPLQVLMTVRAPSAVPAFFDGLRISIAYAAAGATLGELIGAESGLGLYIARSQRTFRVDQVIAGVALVAALSLALFAVVVLTARLAAPWRQLHLPKEDR